jgi:hypothetical protein
VICSWCCFHIPTALIVQTVVFWVVTLYSLIDAFQQERCCFRLQSQECVGFSQVTATKVTQVCMNDQGDRTWCRPRARARKNCQFRVTVLCMFPVIEEVKLCYVCFIEFLNKWRWTLCLWKKCRWYSTAEANTEDLEWRSGTVH